MTLKELFGDVLTPELQEKLPSETKKHLEDSVYLWDGKNKGLEPLPKYRVEEMTKASESSVESLNVQIKQLEETISSRDKDLKTLKKAAEGNDSLTKTIDELQVKNKEEKEAWEKEKATMLENSKKLQKVLWLKENLLNSGVGDPDARDTLALKLQSEFGDKLEYDDKGQLKDLDKIINPLKEKPAFKGMFGEVKLGGDTHIQGTPLGEKTELEKLQDQYDNAVKSNNFVQQVSLKRQISQLQLAEKQNAA